MSLQSTLRSGRVYKKMERDQDDRPLDRVPEDLAQMLQFLIGDQNDRPLNRVPENPEEGDGNEEENGGEQHGGADGAGAMAQMLQLLIGDRRRRDQELAEERRLRDEELRLATGMQLRSLVGTVFLLRTCV